MVDPNSPHAVHLNGRLDGLQGSINTTDLTDNSPPYLAHQYLRVFVARLSPPDTSPTEVLNFTKELQKNLTNGAVTPLHHIFAAIVATSLTELSERVETQVEAQAGIKAMSDSLENGQIFYPSSDGLGWDTAIRELLRQKTVLTSPLRASEHTSSITQPNMAGLQHLAAAAVGEREGADARPASSNGNGTPSQAPKIDHDLSAAVAAANEAAQAQATAAAAQQLSTSPNDNGGDNFGPGGLNQDWS